MNRFLSPVAAALAVVLATPALAQTEPSAQDTAAADPAPAEGEAAPTTPDPEAEPKPEPESEPDPAPAPASAESAEAGLEPEPSHAEEGPPREAERDRDRRLELSEEEQESRIRMRLRRERENAAARDRSRPLIERLPALPSWYTDRSWRVRVRPTFTGWWNVDPSLQPLNPQANVGTGGVSLEAEWKPWADLVVTSGLGYGGSAYESKLFDSLTARTQLHVFSLDVGAGYRFFDLVTPYARVGATYSLLNATITSRDEEYGGWDLFTPGVYGLGGVELTVPRRLVPWQALTPGVFVEVGYQHLGDFQPEAELDEDALIEQRLSPLGTLILGGPTFRLGFVLSF